MDEKIVLCAASAYEKKYYLNQDFASLPEAVRQELQILCVTFTEDVGGILMLVYDEDGGLQIQVEQAEDDFLYDEIGSALKIKQIQSERQELFQSLELFYRIFVLGEEIENVISD